MAITGKLAQFRGESRATTWADKILTHEAEWRDRWPRCAGAVDEELTARQRRVFVAIVLNDVSLDTLVIGLASRRGGICKTLPRPGVSCGPFLPLTG